MNTDKWKRILAGFTLSSDVADVRLCIRDAKEQFCGKETDNEQ